MKITQGLLAISIITLSFSTAADTLLMPSNEKCDQLCWQQRFALEREKMKYEQERFQQQQAWKEKKREENLAEKRENLRLELLSEAKKRCDSENMNSASFNERSLCNAVKSYYSYGVPIPDALLGLPSN